MNRILISSKTNNFQKILHKTHDSVLLLDVHRAMIIPTVGNAILKDLKQL
jgi:hypothetical protein